MSYYLKLCSVFIGPLCSLKILDNFAARSQTLIVSINKGRPNRNFKNYFSFHNLFFFNNRKRSRASDKDIELSGVINFLS
jgi:hypothetical protein